MLTPAQVDHYRTFGYIVLRDYFSPAEVVALRREALRELELQYRHQPFDGTRRQWSSMNVDERAPTFARLLEDERFLDVADQLHGRALPIFCDANRYVHAITGWHPDMEDVDWEWRCAGVKFLHYLDPLTAATGALRVVPGSHRRPQHEAVRRFMETHQPRTEEVPAVICETRPGDVIAFHYPLWHAAVGGSADRWLCTLAYHTAPESAEDLQALLRGKEQQMRDHRQTFGFRGEMFPTSWIARASTDPRRRRVVERLHASGVLAAMGGDPQAAEEALRAPLPGIANAPEPHAA